MTNTLLNEQQYKRFQDKLVWSKLLEGPHYQICNFVPSEFKFVEEWDAVTEPSETEQNALPRWSEAPHALQPDREILYTPTEDKYYRLQEIAKISGARLRASKTAGMNALDAIFMSIGRMLNKEIEAFVFQGPLNSLGATRLTTAGLFNKNGNVSTYNTVKFDAASGPYNAVADMKGLLLADGFGTGKLDLVVDDVAAPYLWRLPATDANFSEGQRIKAELLNGGSIYLSDKLPSNDSECGVGLLVENGIENYNVKTPGGLELGQQSYDARTDITYVRVEGFFCMNVYQPNSICKHVTFDKT